MLNEMPDNGINGEIMRLLGAFFNIFLFNYFMALCGGVSDQSVEQDVETHAVQAREKIEEAGKAPIMHKDASELDYLNSFTPGPISGGVRNSYLKRYPAT